MPKKSRSTNGSKVDLVRNFLKGNPNGTFKDFDEATPGVLSSSYFATMKSQIKKKGELGNGAKKAPRALKKVADNPPVQSALEAKVAYQEQFLAWVKTGMELGYVDLLKDHLG